jgi:hypothetical protein
MARIRSIKPDIYADEAFGNLSIGAQGLFIGLMTQADDEGLQRGTPQLIKSTLWPYKPDLAVEDVEGWLTECENSGMIVRYMDGRRSCIALPNWLRHQRIQHPTPSALPHPPETPETPANTGPHEAYGKPTVSLTPEGKGREGKGEEGKRASAPKIDQTKLPKDFPTDLEDSVQAILDVLLEVHEVRGGHEPTRRGVGLVLKDFPRRDHLAQAHKLRHWATAGRGLKANRKDWAATYRTFVEGAEDAPRNVVAFPESKHPFGSAEHRAELEAKRVKGPMEKVAGW